MEGAAVSVLGVLGLIFSNLPELIALVKKAIETIQGLATQVERKQRLREMTEAIGHAHASKDTSKIEDIFNPKPKPKP
jgi:transketolase N-terminal domain/subunit